MTAHRKALHSQEHWLDELADAYLQAAALEARLDAIQRGLGCDLVADAAYHMENVNAELRLAIEKHGLENEI